MFPLNILQSTYGHQVKSPTPLCFSIPESYKQKWNSIKSENKPLKTRLDDFLALLLKDDSEHKTDLFRNWAKNIFLIVEKDDQEAVNDIEKKLTGINKIGSSNAYVILVCGYFLATEEKKIQLAETFINQLALLKEMPEAKKMPQENRSFMIDLHQVSQEFYEIISTNKVKKESSWYKTALVLAGAATAIFLTIYTGIKLFNPMPSLLETQNSSLSQCQWSEEVSKLFQNTPVIQKIALETLSLNTCCGNNQADPTLLFKLGKFYENEGSLGEAFQCFQGAAKKGNVYAMNSLGDFYRNGIGLNRNLKEACEWYEKGAIKGNAYAMSYLGDCYELGNCYQDKTEVENLSRAFQWYKKGANQGSVHSMSRLGDCYRDGKGVTRDLSLACHWYEKGANQGSVHSMSRLGDCYRDGKGVSQDLRLARQWYEKGAEKGDAYAMSNLGDCYRDGKGVMQDLREARHWYEKGAEKGDTYAMSNLGYFYRVGKGVTQDLSLAFQWYEKGAEKGNAYAMSQLGDCYRDGKGVTQDLSLAFQWYEKGAEKGNAYAMSQLGDCYRDGKGVTQDLIRTFYWYGRARKNVPLSSLLKTQNSSLSQCQWSDEVSEIFQNTPVIQKIALETLSLNTCCGNNQADPTLLFKLGKFYENEGSLGEAFQCFQGAAKKGNVYAMNSLGDFYQNGIGVNRNFKEACEWYEKGAQKGDAYAMSNLGDCYRLGNSYPDKTQVDEDLSLALHWYEKGAALGSAYCMSQLGNFYRDGKGVTQDIIKAIEWYEKAAKKDGLYSMSELGDFYQDGKGVDQNLINALQEHESVRLLLSRGKGVSQDLRLARQWYEKWAALGSAYCMSNLGDCYREGKGLTQDLREARQLIESSTKETRKEFDKIVEIIKKSKGAAHLTFLERAVNRE